MSSSNLFSKKTIEVPAQYVDMANDALKWLIVLLITYAYAYLKLDDTFGGSAGSVMNGDIGWVMRTAAVTAVGFFVYNFVISRVVMFVPKRGEGTYYMALKRS
jgi:hypothetical protein